MPSGCCKARMWTGSCSASALKAWLDFVPGTGTQKRCVINIKKAIFTNFGCFRRLELDFSHGLIAIVGPNGKGKTTVMNGIYAALSNDFSRFPGLKEDSINNMAGPKDESSIYISAEHTGTEFSVYRSLRAPRGTPSHSMTVDGREITGEPGVRAELEKRLGVKKSLLAEYVFVDQWNMFAFLGQTPGDRAATYQLLCGTGKAEKIYAAIGKLLDQDSVLFADVPDNSDDLRVQVSGLTEMLAAAGQERVTAGAGLLKPDKIDLANQYISMRADYDRAAASHKIAQDSVARQQPAIAGLKLSVSRWEKLVAEARKLEVTLRAQADAARGSIGQLRQYQKTAGLRQQLEERLKQVKVVAASRKAPQLDPQDAELNDFNAQLTDVSARLRHNHAMLDTFNDEGIVECPTCGTPVTNLADHLAAVQIQLDADIVAKSELERSIDSILAKRADHQAYSSWKEVQTKMLADITARLAALADTSPPEGDEAQLQQAISDHTDVAANLKNAETKLGEDTRALARAEAALAADANQLALYAGVMAASSAVTDAKLASARNALARHQAARLAVAGVDGRITELQAGITRLQKEIDSVASRMVRNQKARGLRDRLSFLREEVFHRTKLPQVVAQSNLMGMESDIAGVLESFGDPFRVSPSANLSFLVNFPGSPAMAAERLSGGQKAILATAFRISVMSLFGADLGIMSLDEPGAGLDHENMGYFTTAMERYAAKIRGNRQVFVITHSRQFGSSCDQVIDLTLA